jgi:hypothetical protein
MRLQIAIAIVGLAFGLFSERVGNLLPLADIGAPLAPGTSFKNVCFRWSPPECFRERMSTDYLARPKK